MNEITVKFPTGKQDPMFTEKTIHFNDPNFEQMQGAFMAMQTQTGKINHLAAGNFIIETCIIPEDRDLWNEMKKDTKAHTAAALDASEVVSMYHSELKKK